MVADWESEPVLTFRVLPSKPKLRRQIQKLARIKDVENRAYESKVTEAKEIRT